MRRPRARRHRAAASVEEPQSEQLPGSGGGWAARVAGRTAAGLGDCIAAREYPKTNNTHWLRGNSTLEEQWKLIPS